jgi:hypothetical protein
MIHALIVFAGIFGFLAIWTSLLILAADGTKQGDKPSDRKEI